MRAAHTGRGAKHCGWDAHFTQRTWSIGRGYINGPLWSFWPPGGLWRSFVFLWESPRFVCVLHAHKDLHAYTMTRNTFPPMVSHSSSKMYRTWLTSAVISHLTDRGTKWKNFMNQRMRNFLCNHIKRHKIREGILAWSLEWASESKWGYPIAWPQPHHCLHNMPKQSNVYESPLQVCVPNSHHVWHHSEWQYWFLYDCTEKHAL